MCWESSRWGFVMGWFVLVEVDNFVFVFIEGWGGFSDRVFFVFFGVCDVYL